MMADYWPDGRKRVSRLGDPEVVPDLPIWPWPAVKYLLENEKPWLLTGPLPEQAWFRDATNDRNVRVTVREEDGVQGITVRFGQRRARIQDSMAVWHKPPAETVKLLRDLFAVCGVGAWGYPSTLGLELMRRAYPAEFLPEPAPLSECWNDLQTTMTGGRVDTIRLNETIPLATELDLNMAYCAAICDVPAGYPRRTYQSGRGYSQWVWRIPYGVELPLGPLHVRRSDGSLEYPRSGVGYGWYWDIEIEQAKALGVDCIPSYGWVWEKQSNAWSGWADQMWRLRRESRPAIADQIKLITVAAIGALGMTGEAVELMRREDFEGGEPLFSPYGGFDREWNIRRLAAHPGGMVHIASYVRAKVRTWLFAKSLPYARDGRLISTDYDAIRIEGRVKDKSEKMLGGWKKKELHNVMVPSARWLFSDEKVRTPGVARVH